MYFYSSVDSTRFEAFCKTNDVFAGLKINKEIAIKSFGYDF